MLGPPESVLNDIEEFLPSESDSIGEEPPRPAAPQPTDDQDNVSRNSLEDEVSLLFNNLNRSNESRI